jgi:hypothetical protein
MREQYPSMNKVTFTILIFLTGILMVTCGCSQRQNVNEVADTVTTMETTVPKTLVTTASVEIPFVTMTVTDASMKKYPDYCLWTFSGTLSNMGTGKLNDVYMIVTLTDRRSPPSPIVTNQQSVGTVNPGSDRNFHLTATVSCDSDYHASLKYYGTDDAGKLYSGTKNL